MAKSLRSKHKRRMRAIKRIRYGEKELKKLVDMVEKTKEKESKGLEAVAELQTKLGDSMETEVIGTVKSTETCKPLEPKQMEIDQNKQTVRKMKTMLDQNGQYPEWMNGRRLRKQKAIVKRLKKKRNQKK